MNILRCMEEQKLTDGKERKKIFFSYAEDVDGTLLEEVMKNFREHDDSVVYTADPAAPASDELDSELSEMDDMMFFSSPSLYSEKPARTILHDIPFMIGRKVLPFSFEQKDRKWQNLLDEVFLTLYHTKGETYLPQIEIKKIITEAIRVVTRDYANDVPKDMEEPLYRARLSLTREISEEEPSYRTKVVYATALINYGNLKRLRGDDEEALRHLRDAYLMTEKLTEEAPSWDSLIFQAKAASIISRICTEAGDERKARRWMKRCISAAETLKNDRHMDGNPEMPELDMVYIDALVHLAAIAEKEGNLRDALDMLFKADLAIKEYPHMVPDQVIETVGVHIEELASHVLRGIEG